VRGDERGVGEDIGYDISLNRRRSSAQSVRQE
jgi:hypothetical protein